MALPSLPSDVLIDVVTLVGQCVFKVENSSRHRGTRLTSYTKKRNKGDIFINNVNMSI